MFAIGLFAFVALALLVVYGEGLYMSGFGVLMHQ